MPENACNVHKNSDSFMSDKALTTCAMNQHDIFLGFAGAILSFKYIHIKAIVGWNVNFTRQHSPGYFKCSLCCTVTI